MRITSFYLWCFCFTCESWLIKFRWDSLPQTSFVGMVFQVLVQWSFQSHIHFEAKENNPTTTHSAPFPSRWQNPWGRLSVSKNPMARKVCPSFHAAWLYNDIWIVRLKNDRVDQMINVYPYSGSLNQMLFLEILFHWWVVPAICIECVDWMNMPKLRPLVFLHADLPVPPWDTWLLQVLWNCRSRSTDSCLRSSKANHPEGDNYLVLLETSDLCGLFLWQSEGVSMSYKIFRDCYLQQDMR